MYYLKLNKVYLDLRNKKSLQKQAFSKYNFDHLASCKQKSNLYKSLVNT